MILGILYCSFNPVTSPFAYLSLISIGILILVYIQTIRIKMFRQKYIGAFISYLFFILGCVLCSNSQAAFNPSHISNKVSSEYQIIGQISTVPSINSKIQTQITLRKLIVNAQEEKLEGKVNAFIAVSEESKALNYGDEVLLNTKIYPIKE